MTMTGRLVILLSLIAGLSAMIARNMEDMPWREIRSAVFFGQAHAGSGYSRNLNSAPPRLNRLDAPFQFFRSGHRCFAAFEISLQALVLEARSGLPLPTFLPRILLGDPVPTMVALTWGSMGDAPRAGGGVALRVIPQSRDVDDAVRSLRRFSSVAIEGHVCHTVLLPDGTIWQIPRQERIAPGQDWFILVRSIGKLP